MNLNTLVQDWKRWSANADKTENGWEVDFPRWGRDVIPAIQSALQRAPDPAGVEAILFFMGRDHEDEQILDILVETHAIAESVVLKATEHEDSDVRWQIAVVLGRRATTDSLDALEPMLADHDEYVRRRALLAIRGHRRQVAESTSIEWLSAKSEYSRMVALDTLAAIQSTRLKDALDVLANDPSPIVKKRLARIAEAGRT